MPDPATISLTVWDTRTSPGWAIAVIRMAVKTVTPLILDKRYLLHDRDAKFVHGFDRMLRASGVEPVVLPPRSPRLKAYCERFVRSISEEVLDQMIVIGEGALRYVIQSYLTHDHHERNHQGLGNQLMVPESGMEDQRGVVVRRERLDGLLSYYHREAA